MNKFTFAIKVHLSILPKSIFQRLMTHVSGLVTTFTPWKEGFYLEEGKDYAMLCEVNDEKGNSSLKFTGWFIEEKKTEFWDHFQNIRKTFYSLSKEWTGGIFPSVAGFCPGCRRFVEFELSSESKFMLQLTLCEKCNEYFYRILEVTGCYEITHNPRGICLIIANEKFKNKEDNRVGTGEDVKIITKTFEWLQFRVVTVWNCTAAKMIEELTQKANLDHTGYDMFVCFILSHGNKEGICGTDSVPISELDIRKLFYGNECKSLLGKPKLFFIQACRGIATDFGTRLEEHSATSPTQENLGQAFKDLKTDGSCGPDNEKVLGDSEKPDHQPVKQGASGHLIPNDCDFVFSHSTTPGFVSGRDPQEGSIFIVFLCEKLQQAADRKDLYTMLMDVNERMTALKFFTNEKPVKYSPDLNINLRFALHFRLKETWTDYCDKHPDKPQTCEP